LINISFESKIEQYFFYSDSATVRVDVASTPEFDDAAVAFSANAS